jgi:hypothetical protein
MVWLVCCNVHLVSGYYGDNCACIHQIIPPHTNNGRSRHLSTNERSHIRFICHWHALRIRSIQIRAPIHERSTEESPRVHISD